MLPPPPPHRFSIPPLEGFVSNKTSDEGDSSVDPIEQLLYLVFVANSERMRVSDTAAILNVDVHELQVGGLGLGRAVGLHRWLLEAVGHQPAQRRCLFAVLLYACSRCRARARAQYAAVSRQGDVLSMCCCAACLADGHVSGCAAVLRHAADGRQRAEPAPRHHC